MKFPGVLLHLLVKEGIEGTHNGDYHSLVVGIVSLHPNINDQGGINCRK